jgi:hypothetical protein
MVLATDLNSGGAAGPLDRRTLLGTLHVLPDHIIQHCLSFLSPADLAVTSLVCRKLRVLSNEESLWRVLCHRDFPLQPKEQPHKLHYQTYYNIKKERYAEMPALSPPNIPLFKGNQTLRYYPRYTQNIGLFYEGSSLLPPLPPQADVNNLYMEWNGNQLALACLDEKVPSVQIFGIQGEEFVKRQSLPLQTVGFVWVREQLVTATISEGRVLIQIWNPDPIGNLQVMYSCEAPGSERVLDHLDSRQENHGFDDNFYESLAWDGQWLALVHQAKRDDVNKIGVNVWKVSEGQLKQEAFLATKEYMLSDLLRWKGDLLFIHDGTSKIQIWDRNTKAYVQAIDCIDLADEDAYITDFLIHGNQLFVAYGNTISLWEADQHGTYTLVYSIFRTFDCSSLNFDRSCLYVRAGSIEDSLCAFNFSASPREILESLCTELQELTKWDYSDKEYIKRGLKLVYKRFRDLPPAITESILLELNPIEASSSNKRTYEDLNALEFDPLKLIQAIDNYLEIEEQVT